MSASQSGTVAARDARYTNVAIALHWLIAFLIIGQVAGGLYMSDLPDEKAAEKFELFQWHKSFGITILLLSLARLGWRLTHKPPAYSDELKDWERRLAKVTHIGFYLFMIAVPLGGWMVVSASPFAESVPTLLYGVIPWPHLPFFGGVEDRSALAGQLAEMHEYGAFAIIGLFLLHMAGLFKHLFMDDTNVVLRMIPGGSKRDG